ncbi:MAG: transcription elongation factor GreA [Dehalococcoidia bacterium]|jgi:transcription elongation factor GreA|nr:transcription elongation factor GreA [Dehalococcoidia bacterium]
MTTQKRSYLTRAGREKLEAELNELRNVRRLDVMDHLYKAKESSGTEENSDYEDARNEQAFLEGRILEVEGLLKNAVLIEESHAPGGRIKIGSHFTLLSDEGDKGEYTVVGSAEAAAAHGRISNESPVGHAVLGHRKGDKVDVKIPAGVIKYSIVSVD